MISDKKLHENINIFEIRPIYNIEDIKKILKENSMDNNTDSVLDMYLFEAKSLMEQLDEILLKAEQDQAFDTECINEIFRIMHTIKGSSAMMQYNSIMTVAHKIEDLFYYIRENGIKHEFNEPLVNMVFKFTDFIKGEIEKIENDEPLTANIEEQEKEIHNFLLIISGQKESAETADEERAGSQTIKKEQVMIPEGCDSTYAIKIKFDDDCGMENLRAFLIVNQLRDAIKVMSFSPDDIESNSETCTEIVNNGFYIYLNSKDDVDKAINVVKSSMNVSDYTVIENEAAATNKMASVSEEEESKPQQYSTQATDTQPKQQQDGQEPASKEKHNKQSLITVNLSKLDKLVDMVGEVVITESMVTSSPEIKSLNSDNVTKATRQLRKLTDELQDVVMSLRMVPVSGVFQKMRRIVRDMGKDLNKDAELILVGDETEVDKTIVDAISDPIMHLVRNSMDHGIETKEERARTNKNPRAKVVLTALNTGGEILITIEDDGKGFDKSAILAKAKKNGLLTKLESEYTSKEVFQLLMLPGFSTNDKVTEYSGRGVGLDVVKKNVEKIGGSVLLESEEGKGSKTTFKIPLTLAILAGMQVVVGNTEFIIPIKNIEQSLHVSEKDVVHNNDGSDVIIIRNECYDVVKLNEYFGIYTDITNLEDGIIILVNANDRKYCIFVDKLLGEQQVVVKPLPAMLNKYGIKESGIAGCSTLGDGSISLILEVSNIQTNM